MKRLVTLAVLVAIRLSATQVTATVTSSENAPYANGTYRATLVDANGNPLFLGPGASNYSGQRIYTGSLDSTGTFSVTLTDNASILTGSQWAFTICSLPSATTVRGPATCFSSAQTISGSTQSLTAALSAVAPSIAITTPPLILPADPVSTNQAATKSYVDAHSGGSGGGGGSTAFPALTGGTNTTAAMVVGSGASLAATGSGTIAATSVPASGVSGLAASATTDTTNASNIGSGTLPAGRLPATVVVTGNATGSGTKYASATGAGTSGNCVKWDASGNLADVGSPCGSGSGSLPTQTGFNGAALVTNGTTPSWVTAITAGPSGALDCAPADFGGQYGICDIVTAVVPRVAAANTFTGTQTMAGIFSTQGVTSATDATIASATTIAPNGSLVFVTGTTPIATITPPTGCTTSGTDCFLTLISDPATGPYTLTTAGNIYSTYAAVLGQGVRLVYFPASAKWYQVH